MNGTDHFDKSAELPASAVARLLLQTGMTVTTAESCTGGLLAGALTEVAGSSAYFYGGVVSYDNKVKTGLLGVPPEMIAEHRAVSAAVALAMAHNVRALVGADIALAVTGIAGPSGATPNKPVGTTYIAIVAEEFEDVRHFRFERDRAGNRALSVQEALAMLEAYLESRAPQNVMAAEIGATTL